MSSARCVLHVAMQGELCIDVISLLLSMWWAFYFGAISTYGICHDHVVRHSILGLSIHMVYAIIMWLGFSIQFVKKSAI